MPIEEPEQSARSGAGSRFWWDVMWMVVGFFALSVSQGWGMKSDVFKVYFSLVFWKVMVWGILVFFFFVSFLGLGVPFFLY
ncbi:uncharacterized protein BDW47DRAFT_65919 [Aspergillus candidus]|uniref:Uncharacterized protein n=1 Tax=Aspergillus candidus TaxID=41067 RepID=A0A2I2FKX7_ASPCN|nr:hypothetical protein BDW47DRAFT_65919 [Aspergillus candidus]PLB41254.1 hypothetical protein BDW47DRAFT_65919 [Aspergillus candidus]